MNHTIRFIVPALASISTPELAYDVNEQFSVGGILAGAIQCQNLSDAPGYDDTCEYGIPFQPEMSFRPNESDEVFFKLGFAAGNGLNEVTPFRVSPWAASLENDVKNINGRDRDYLLSAWYKHTFTVDAANTIDATFGIIDATDYLDENAYANDEYTQFMNAALTNGPNVFLPSYDIGASAVWHMQQWAFSGVVMDIGENEDGNNTTFYGLQAEYKAITPHGTGNYRVIVSNTSKDFLHNSLEYSWSISKTEWHPGKLKKVFMADESCLDAFFCHGYLPIFTMSVQSGKYGCSLQLVNYILGLVARDTNNF